MQTACSFRTIQVSGLALVFAFGLGLSSTLAYASQSRITFVATINNRSALLPGKWLIYKISDLRHPVETLPGHSGTVQLAPGKYRAKVILNHKTRETDFKVETEVDKLVTVAMD